MVWIGRVCSDKFRRDFVARTFALIAPVRPILHRVQCSSETIPNEPNLYETQQNTSLESNGVDRVRSQRKFPTRLRGMNFCINCTSSAHFAPSLVHQRNGPECTQTLRNTLKHEFRVQLCGSGVLTGSDVTSWHELLHQLHQFGPFCTEFSVVVKRSQMNPNFTKCKKYEFRVQLCGSGAFIMKSSGTTSWYELLH